MPPQSRNQAPPDGGHRALEIDRLAGTIKRKPNLTASPGQAILKPVPAAAMAGVTKYCGTAAFTGLETLSFWIEEVRHKLRRGELLRDLGQLDEADQDEIEAEAAALIRAMVAVIAEQRRAA